MPTTVEQQAVPHAFTPEEIDRQLARLLASHHFCNSQRYPALLQYLVQQVQMGNAALLKERLVGIAVFHRAPDYDTNINPVVRVTAGEVRKRIAQYYQEPEHFGELRIELPTGSYVPRFLPGRISNQAEGEASIAALRSTPEVTRSGGEFKQSVADAPAALGHVSPARTDAFSVGDSAASLRSDPKEIREVEAADAAAVAPQHPTSSGSLSFSRKRISLLLVLASLLGAGLAVGGFLLNSWVVASRTRTLNQLWAPMHVSSTPLLFVVGDHSLDNEGHSMGVAPLAMTSTRRC